MSQPLLSIFNLTKAYGGSRVLHELSLEVAPGEFVALLGPSGCGKTTLLRCIAGFEKPDAGLIKVDGIDMADEPPYRRPVNTVFQNYALFPHMSVIDNVAYGPRRQGLSKAAARDEAVKALALVGLDALADRLPRQLSGGQQQRAALARAVVNRPKLLLLDEPLSALDLKLRKRMQHELKDLQRSLGMAFVFVTHDQEEALAMADRIVVMNEGRVEQVGTGAQIYRSPATRFVADFIGEANLIECIADPDGHLRPGIGTLSIPASVRSGGHRHVAVLRPEQIQLVSERGAGISAGLSIVDCVVEDCVMIGGHTRLRASAGALTLTVLAFSAEMPLSKRGDRVTLGFRPEHLHVIAE